MRHAVLYFSFLFKIARMSNCNSVFSMTVGCAEDVLKSNSCHLLSDEAMSAILILSILRSGHWIATNPLYIGGFDTCLVLEDCLAAFRG